MGTRLGEPTPKALLPAGGRPLVVHAVRRLAEAGLEPPVVVHPPGSRDAFLAALDNHEVALVEGRATRTDSVRAGLAAVDPGHVLVAVHDAARPLVPVEVVRVAVAAVHGDVLAAAPALPVADTLKRVYADQVLGTVDRTSLRAVQTPQVFVREVLDDVLATGDGATDELALVERAIDRGQRQGRVVVTPGSLLGLKVTYPDDLWVVDALVQALER